MQKGLCIVAITISLIVFIVFLADLVMGMLSLETIAPFNSASMLIDIVFVVCSLVLGVMSWLTFREQV